MFNNSINDMRLQLKIIGTSQIMECSISIEVLALSDQHILSLSNETSIQINEILKFILNLSIADFYCMNKIRQNLIDFHHMSQTNKHSK